ncbi:MAG: trehalose-phosphatase [Syntrophobacteraceae bacterium]
MLVGMLCNNASPGKKPDFKVKGDSLEVVPPAAGASTGPARLVYHSGPGWTRTVFSEIPELTEDGMNRREGVSLTDKTAFDGVIFDLDGVVTRTARVHAAAWKRLFDEYLKGRAPSPGEDLHPFDENGDYRRHVDGKPRSNGIQSFLASRGIHLPHGDPEDAPDRETVCGLGNRKNRYFHQELRERGVEVFETTIRLIQSIRNLGFKTAIVSSSKNCRAVVKAASIGDLFDVIVDGVDAERLDLPGKPAPDLFLEAARRLRIEPSRAMVVEDAVSGVEAGRNGDFGCVVGVDRADHADLLRAHGADVVVKDLQEIAVNLSQMRDSPDLPDALEHFKEIRRRAKGRRLAVFLDYDGTLTPIVQRPDLAVLSETMRRTVSELAAHCTVAVISGRDLKDVRKLVGINSITYAGSHGFDIAGPSGSRLEYEQGRDFLPAIERAEMMLGDRLKEIPGALVERKKFSVAAHYREVPEEKATEVENAVDDILAAERSLRKTAGKKVFEVQPDIDWHKGKALRWLLDVLELDGPDVLPIYIGDDITDEDAFRAIDGYGIAILVTEIPGASAAHYSLRDPVEVRNFLQILTSRIVGGK